MGVPVRPRLAVHNQLTYRRMRKRLLPFFLFIALACVRPLAGYAIDVTSASDLANIAAQSATTDFAGQTINLNADIDLDSQTWTPIGTAEYPFRGRFKGNGHLIKGLRAFNGSLNGAGLFGYVAQEGSIEQVGISGGYIMAKAPGRRRIGALVGVCDGTIKQCWSMAMIVAAGNVCGGLVGELTEHGKMEDCYHSGLILNGTDTIGGIVGLNRGSLTRVYNTGYAKNGKAIVGVDLGGTYKDCYYDRKLYYQQPGVVDNNVTPIDVTSQMFSLFKTNLVWSKANDRYPVLTAFGTTKNAVILSAAPMFINTTETNPINHANDLTTDFTLSTLAAWTCQQKDDEQWIQINGIDVTVVRPCTETDVLVDAERGDEKRVVYMRPRRWNDFLPGSAMGIYKTFCFEEEALLSANIQNADAQFGWELNRYYYMLQLSQINAPGDTVAIDTLYDDNATPADYKVWFSGAQVPTDKAGLFVIRRFAHDSVCVLDWVRSKGEFVYRVFEPFDPGEIKADSDTVYLPDVVVNVPSIRPATGGGGPITYIWQQNGSKISGQEQESLTDYKGITQADTYTFTRLAHDSALCYGDKEKAEGKFVLLVLDPFDPGTVTEEKDLQFCTVEDAKKHTIKASLASGGLPDYHYQWYTVNGTDTTVIPGATKQNLSLASFNLQAGQTYTYVRKATDDAHILPYIRSKKQQTFYIMNELDPGSMEKTQMPDYCAPYNASEDYLITVSYPATAATGESTLEYRWVRICNGVRDVLEGTNTQNLNVKVMLSDVRGKTYTYIREVRNHPECEWIQTDGETSQYYGQDTRTEVIKTICKELLPYTLTWIDGSSHEFTYDGETWEVKDLSGKCEADTVFIIKTVQTPSFTMDTTAHICQETRTMSIPYTLTEGLSDKFRITYSDDMSVYMGRKDTVGTITTPGIIFLTNVPPIGVGDCYLELEIGYTGGVETDEICYSTPTKLQVDFSLGGYLHTKYDRVLFVDNNPANGLTTGGSEKLKFVAYQWYKNGQLLPGETKQYYHEGGANLVGIFYVVLTAESGESYRSCDITLPTAAAASAPEHSIVYPNPVSVNEPVSIKGFGTAQILSFYGDRIGQAIQVVGQATLAAPSMTGLYYVQLTTEEGVVEMHKIIVK